MCIKDKIWLKRFGLALWGVSLYLLDTGTDTWVGNSLIQNCHLKFGASVLCLVYVLPGVFAIIGTLKPKSTFVLNVLAWTCLGLAIGIFFVPLSILALLWDLIKLDDKTLENAKQ